MAGLSMGGMQTQTIAPANLDKFSAIGLFSGGSISPESIANKDEFKAKVKLVFVGYGSKELGGNRGGFGGDPKAATDGLKADGINAHFIFRKILLTSGSLGDDASMKWHRYYSRISQWESVTQWKCY